MTTRTNWILALATLAVAVWGFAGCAHGGPAPAEQPETVGQLAPSYNSIAVAPVHAATPPPSLAFVAGSDDDDVSSTVSTVVRADAGEDAAPDVQAKGGGLVLGGGR